MKIAIVGFGEVGGIFASDLAQAGRLAAFDVAPAACVNPSSRTRP